MKRSVRPHRQRVPRTLAMSFLVILVALSTACRDRQLPSAADGPNNVLIILVDALRADHLGCYGYPRNTSPSIDAMSRDGVVFEWAMTPASWTKPSIPSLFTGLYPSQHQVYSGNKADVPGRISSDVLSDAHVTLAEAYRSAGYATGAFVHNSQIRGFLGFDQGFDLYEEELGEAFDITERAYGWISTLGDQPFFAYAHLLDPHWPYRPPAPFDRLFPLPEDVGIDFNEANWKLLKHQVRTRNVTFDDSEVESMRTLYDGCIRYADAAIGQLLASLEALGVLDDTIVVLTADHGEEFMDHGSIGHGNSLYDELLRVPLVISGPGTVPGRVGVQVGLVDLFPTLLDLSHIEPPASTPGRSLVPALRGDELEASRTFADHRPGGDSGEWLQSVRGDRYKFIRTFALPESDSDVRDVPAIAKGSWVEVELITEEGRVCALEVEHIDPRDTVSLRGQVDSIDLESGRISVLGVSCRLTAGSRVRDSDKRDFDRERLTTGAWVRVRGHVDDGGFQVTKLDLASTEKRGVLEIKAPVLELNVEPGESGELVLAGLAARIDEHTDFEGFSTEASAQAQADRRRLTIAELRTLREDVGVELYDLLLDPGERTNLAHGKPDLVVALSRELDRWEQEHEPTERMGDAVVLDHESVEQLRALGYVQ